MKAKKVLGLLLSVAMVTGLMTGCGNDDSGNSSNGGAMFRAADRQTTVEIPAVTSPIAERPTAEKLTAAGR